MKKEKQILVIHGGDSFATHAEYIEALESYTVSLMDGQGTGWKSTLQKELGADYTVTLPRMPNSHNAKYAEWKLWFEKYIPLLDDGVILIGHSLGGSFLAKYLSEVEFPKKIGATFLISPPFDMDDGRKLVEFDQTSSLELLQEQGGEIYLYHSKDDPVVEFSEFLKYQTALPDAHVRIFEDKGHFNQESFPEIVEGIKSLTQTT
jgi:uncharacterized protein